jgi:hypothetical protein
MPHVDNCPKCSRVRVNYWCLSLCTEQVEGVELLRNPLERFHTAELELELQRRSALKGT